MKRARGLEANGWSVQADIRGFKRPPVMNHARPDIVAKKGTRTRIIEVETPDTRFRDRPQHRKLREYARNHKKTEFNVRTCDM
jgi:hypothetical protein